MIELRMARLTPTRRRIDWHAPLPSETSLAFSYLYLFRRVLVGLAVVGAVVAFSLQQSGLFWACVCIGIGELLECSYYLAVLHWRQRQRPRQAVPR